MKTLLKNGFIVDGFGSGAYKGNVVLDSDRIDSVTQDPIENVENFDGQVIDCTGCVIAPGFIDMHSHHDRRMDIENPIPYFKTYVEQGITTFIGGNCGNSAAGYDKETPAKRLKDGFDGYLERYDLPDYSDMGDWFDAVHRKIPCNIASLQGHGAIRRSLVAGNPSPLSPELFKQQCDIAERSLAEGAAGISLGLMYSPGLFAPRDELLALASLVKKYDRILTVHPRAQAYRTAAYPLTEEGRSHNLLALDEIVSFGDVTGCRLEYSHAIMMGTRTFETNDSFLRELETAYDRGVDITFDLYAWDCGASMISFIMPRWYHALSLKDRMSPENLANFKREFEELETQTGFGYSNIRIAYVANTPSLLEIEGMWLPEIAKKWNADPFDAYIRIVSESGNKARILMDGYYTDEIIEKQAKHPLGMYMTDSWYEPAGTQNIHIYSGFARFLEMCREGKAPVIEKTIRKMSGMAADRFKLRNRGYLRNGYFADVTVFKLEDVKSYENKKPEGIRQVFINGKHVLKNGAIDEYALQNAGYAIRVF